MKNCLFPRPFCRALAACLVLMVPPAMIRADEVGVRVPSFARFDPEPESARLASGLLLLGELNCTACHQPESAWGLLSKQSPRLTEMAERVRPEFVRVMLRNPAAADPGTTMPHLLHGLSDSEQSRRIEALVHFLAADGAVAEAAPVSAGVQRGQSLFHSVGCVACHDPLNGQSAPLPTSVPLRALSKKYSVPGLAKFLQDPLHVRPSGRMPALQLTAEEARDLACFLLRDLEVPSSLTFEYYEGDWQRLPDFGQLTAKSRGVASAFDVNVGQPDHFAVRFRGKFRVEQNGQYRFYLSSDDGSRLIIDGQTVLENDEIHPLSTKDAKVQLTAGEHEVVVEYFEGGGEQELRVEYDGRGLKRQSLEFALVVPPDPANANRPQRLVVQPDLVETGRELFQSEGCAACHERREDNRRLPPRRLAKKMAELGEGGCLAPQPSTGLPRYDLTAPQRSALQLALRTLQSNYVANPTQRVAAALAAFNCYACHERDGIGGVEPARNPHFQTNQPEMGDEGRLPPSLTGVGAKLRPEWLQQVLAKGAKDRPYMFTRMPRFGNACEQAIQEHLVSLDRAAAAPTPPAPTESLSERRVKATGRQLTGERGMSCVKCHTWGKERASGIQAISLTTMAARLDDGWFRRYLLNPQTYRPGTRMPAAWPDGQSPFANILNGDSLRQIQAIWTFLSDGDRAATPLGIGQQPIELVATTEPVLYRNFIEGAGTRAIGVGYPQHVNLAFDANASRLAMLWQGAFIDASLHWVGRGPGFQKPLGDHVLHLPDGVPFAVLDSHQQPWPKLPSDQEARTRDRDATVASPRVPDIQFRGYRLDQQRRPIFLYRWRGIDIEDECTPQPADHGATVTRTLRLSAPAPNGSWFRVLAAGRLDPLPTGAFQVDGDWQVEVHSAAGTPVSRTSEGQQELLVPLPSPNGPSVISIRYHW